MITDRTRRAAPKLAEVLGERGAGRWLILTHDNPDPDSIASAALLAGMLRRRFHHRVTIAYGGLIGRAENREMVRVLKLRLIHRRHVVWSRYRHFALVDTQPRTGNNQLPAEIVPDVVFDHHPVRRATRSVPFHDVRTDYGATATILAEYALEAGLELSRRTVTALVYAIRTETQDFRREFSGPDRDLYDEFLPQADNRALGKIQSPPLPLSYFATLHRALEHLQGVENLVVSHVGEVAQPDIVPEIADLLLRLEGKTWSLATGVWEGRLYLSIRTTNPRAEAGRIMRKLIGRQGKGGGHGMTAGGWMEVESEGVEAMQRRLGEKLAKALNRKPERWAGIELPR